MIDALRHRIYALLLAAVLCISIAVLTSALGQAVGHAGGVIATTVV